MEKEPSIYDLLKMEILVIQGEVLTFNISKNVSTFKVIS